MTTNVKIFASERLGDASNAGGRCTGTEVADGVVNNVLPNISKSDRVGGRINMAKLYAKDVSATTQLVQAVNVMIDREPADPAVSGVLFSTGSWSDKRSDEAKYIESYLAPSTISRLYPYDLQAKNQRAVIMLQRPDLPLPEIGQVYELVNSSSDQPVRIASVASSVQTFTDINGDYQLRAITMGITQALQYDFPGGQPTRYSVPAPTLVRNTIVADSANYYGISKLASDVSAGALDATLASIFAQLLPSTYNPVSVTGASPSQSHYAVASGVAHGYSFEFGNNEIHLGTPIYLGMSIFPGSLTVISATGSRGDDGKGNITLGNDKVGTIDYERGSITPLSPYNWASASGNTGTVAAFTPAAFVSRDTYTAQQPVTVATRDQVYNATLNPLPAPATLSVSYSVSGTWYTLQDDGTGLLTGGQGNGSGTVRYDTGINVNTLGALPDIGSSIVWSWGIVSDYEIRVGDVTIQPPAVTGQLGHAANPSSVSITWTSGGVTKTATDNGSGALSGDGTGTIQYSKLSADGLSAIGGSFMLRPTLLPDKTATYAVAYNDTSVGATLTTITPTHAGGNLTFTVPGAPLQPGGVSLYVTTHHGASPGAEQLNDNGAGGFYGFGDYGPLATGIIVSGATIDYTTGHVIIPDGYTESVSSTAYAQLMSIIPSRVADGTSLQYMPTSTALQLQNAYSNVAVNFIYLPSSTISLRSVSSGGTTRSQTDSFAAPPLTIDLTPSVSSPVIPNSVAFTFGGSRYVDRAGTLYRNIDYVTNAGTIAGTFAPTTGIATITDWTPGASPSLTIQSLLTQPGLIPITIVNGRTPGSPIRPSSFQVSANLASDGTLVTATADANGNIASANMHGFIAVQAGVYNIAFGAYVLDSGLTSGDKAQPWYNPANVGTDGYIFRPNPVVPGSIKYNCVVQSFLPQNPLLLGLDPTRLPIDGRVPIFRPGYKMILHDDNIDTLPTGLTSGQVISLSRGKLSKCVLYDNHGALVTNVSNAVYTVDLAASPAVVTMGSALDLNAYTQPLVAKHRVEDEVECLQANIGGQVKFSPGLVHGYTAANSRCSSLLEGGDVQARYDDPFYLQTWGNVFADLPSGDPITPALDLLTYPIEVLNRDCETIRVAMIFTSSTTGNVVIEGRGVVGTFNTSTNLAILNLSGNPIYVLNHLAFGTGWATGNAIRINFYGAGISFVVVRTTLQAPATDNTDSMTITVGWS